MKKKERSAGKSVLCSFFLFMNLHRVIPKLFQSLKRSSYSQVSRIHITKKEPFSKDSFIIHRRDRI